MVLRLVDFGLRGLRAVGRRVSMRGATAMHRAVLRGCGSGTVFQAGVRISAPQNVTWGDDGYIWRGLTASSEKTDGQLDVGHRVQINADVHLDFTGGLRICDDVLISAQAVIYTHDHGLDPRSAPALCPKTIAPGAWIGMRAVILPGCRMIGAGAVIGAGAIVTRNVPAGAIVAGNPARVVGQRQRQVAEVAA